MCRTYTERQGAEKAYTRTDVERLLWEEDYRTEAAGDNREDWTVALWQFRIPWNANWL